MIVYRLARAPYRNDLTGKGAAMFGGRWNSVNVPMLYTASSRALCTTEVAVHTPLGMVPDDYYLVTIELPKDSMIAELNPKMLPDNWKSFPYKHKTQDIGDKFINKNEYLALRVPSVIVQGDYNYLINPLHVDIKKVRLLATEAFIFDERLFGNR